MAEKAGNFLEEKATKKELAEYATRDATTKKMAKVIILVFNSFAKSCRISIID